MANITRAEAVALIQSQMAANGDLKERFAKDDALDNVECHHYGYCELRLLLDAIYGPFKDDDVPLTPTNKNATR